MRKATPTPSEEDQAPVSKKRRPRSAGQAEDVLARFGRQQYDRGMRIADTLLRTSEAVMPRLPATEDPARVAFVATAAFVHGLAEGMFNDAVTPRMVRHILQSVADKVAEDYDLDAESYGLDEDEIGRFVQEMTQLATRAVAEGVKIQHVFEDILVVFEPMEDRSCVVWLGMETFDAFAHRRDDIEGADLDEAILLQQMVLLDLASACHLAGNPVNYLNRVVYERSGLIEEVGILRETSNHHVIHGAAAPAAAEIQLVQYATGDDEDDEEILAAIVVLRDAKGRITAQENVFLPPLGPGEDESRGVCTATRHDYYDAALTVAEHLGVRDVASEVSIIALDMCAAHRQLASGITAEDAKRLKKQAVQSADGEGSHDPSSATFETDDDADAGEDDADLIRRRPLH